MLAKPIQIIRASAAPRRVPAARLIRRHVDTLHLKSVWRAEIYRALLLLEERAEQSREALRANDDTAAVALGRDLALGAVTISRALDRLKALPPQRPLQIGEPRCAGLSPRALIRTDARRGHRRGWKGDQWGKSRRREAPR